MGTTVSRGRRSGPWLVGLVLVAAVMLSACTGGERKDIRLTPTATADPGVRIIVDNCPGPDTVSLSVRDELLWQIEAATPPTDSPTVTDEAVLTATSGLFEFQVGETPDGWRTTMPLEQPVREGIRYTISTEPDGKAIDFSVPDLATGLLYDGEILRQIVPGLMDIECDAQADFGEFSRDIAVLGALWLTSAALALVTLITLLFVITRRFSRIRSIERRAARQTELERLGDERERTPV